MPLKKFPVQYVDAANILSTHNFVDLQNHENFFLKEKLLNLENFSS